MHYFSERALKEHVHDGQLTSRKHSWRFGLSRILTAEWSKERTEIPSACERVDRALKLARGKKRQVRQDPWESTESTLLDTSVEDLHVGVMPFAHFGEYTLGEASVTWGHTSVNPRDSFRKHPLEIVVVGSPDNVSHGGWVRGWTEEALAATNSFPSEPSVLADYVRKELQLNSAKVNADTDASMGYLDGPGHRAIFAWQETERARRTWDRQIRVPTARLVAAVLDTADETDRRIILARPILIEETS